ncbi:alpha/beta hydrolase-fold protein [uncultured Flavobacterium sp.]|uniref:alpha/beta hydrolase n=1 Tax=uncultured Flavobacterium sp. TaxID=165435 RepID=UPI0030CA2177|tara:strand:+ start:500 stop:1327 length:828 start_codon:yes stop_codon:yes gene_type:complete
MRTLVIFILISNFVFSQEIDENKYYAETKTIFIKSEIFEKERELQIYFPDEYFKETAKRFKIIYLFDAQNQRIFNYVKGNVELLSMNYIEPMIIVGIVTEDRWFEFLPKNNNIETLKEYEPPIGGADGLINHIKNEVEPYLLENFRVKNERIGIGHSLGGTFLMYFNTLENDFFDSNILLSPNFSYDDEQMIERIKIYNNSLNKKAKDFFIFSGFGDSYEEKFNTSLKKINKWLKKNKSEKINWQYEQLKINDHGKIWFEGIYKGLLKIESIKKT